MSKDLDELERLYLDGKKQAEQFKVLFDDVVPSRAIKDRQRLVGVEMRIEEVAPASERPHTTNALKLVRRRAKEWTKSVNGLLDEIGKYRLQFNYPKEKGFQANKTDLTKNEKALLEVIDNMTSRVIALREIIVDIDKNDERYRKATSEKSQRFSGKIAYKLKYNQYSGELTLGETLVLKTRLDSAPDESFRSAFKNPNKPVKVRGNMSSTIGNLKIPSILKEIMFRCSKGAFQVNPIITEDDLLKYSINKQVVDQELRELTQ